MAEPRVESMLVSLGDSIDWPTPSPQLSKWVVARIEAEAAPAQRRRLSPALVLVAVLVATVLIVLSPSARKAVADLLSVAGIRVGVTAEEAPVIGAHLDLGELIALDSLRDVVDFQVRVPAGQDTGIPDGVYLSESGQVSMVWAGSPTIPAAGDTGVGVLLTQQKASFENVGEKVIGPDTGVSSLTVNGRPGLWIEGATHTLTLLDAEDNPIEETTRLAANVLLWESFGINHRLETTGDLDSALAIARTLEPVP